MSEDLLDVVERMRLGEVLYRDPDLVIKAAARIVDLEQENKVLRLKSIASLANNLCPDHRDKQKGKPCLACEIENRDARIAELERAQHDTQADASRWRFTRDNRLQYFEPTRHWRTTSSDGHVICEGRAANYETAVDAAMQATRLAEAPKP